MTFCCAPTRAVLIYQVLFIDKLIANSLSHSLIHSFTQDINRETPLIIASRYGYNDIVKLLVKYGANINHRGKGGDTAIMHACFNNHLDIAYFLLQHNANISVHLTRDNCASSQFYLMFQKAYLHAHKSLCQALLGMNHQVYHHYQQSINSDNSGTPATTDQLLQYYGTLIAPVIADDIMRREAVSIHTMYLQENRWHRRKDYIHFLIACGYRYHKGSYRYQDSVESNLTKIFSIEGIVRTICVYI